MTIKAVMFDYGNVLSHPQHDSDIEGMASVLGVSVDVFSPLYWELREDYDRFEFDGRTYWTQIATKARLTISDEQISQLILLDSESWSHPNHEMADWVKVLRDSGIAAGIISNMPPELRVHIAAKEWLPEFDHYTFSCDIKAVKPAPEVYLHCLEGLGVAAGEALFLDDRQPNIDAGKELGIESVLFKTADHLGEHIEKIGLPPLRAPSKAT